MGIKLRNPFVITKSGVYPSYVRHLNGNYEYFDYPGILSLTAANCDTATTQGQMDAYTKCAPVNSVVNKQSEALRNGRFLLIDSKGNEARPDKYMAQFLTQPNPLQSFKQFIANAYSFAKIHGIAYCLPVYGFSKREPSSFWVVPNFMVTPEYTNKVFGQTKIEEIISGYKIQGISESIKAEDVLIFRDSGISNTSSTELMLKPQSRLTAVADQVNSVIASTDSWLRISERKGVPLGIFSSGGKDSISSIPLTAEEKEDAQTQLQGYGMTKLAKQFILTSAALNYQQISLPVRDLMLLEGIEASSRHICNQYNYPFELMGYQSNASLANGGEIKEAEKRHYQNQIIPDAAGMCETINTFFALTNYTLQVFFDHLECFQKSKEETGRALLTLTAGLDKAYIKRAITLEEYRAQVAVIMDIDPNIPNGKTYYNGEITAAQTVNAGGNQSDQSGSDQAN